MKNPGFRTRQAALEAATEEGAPEGKTVGLSVRMPPAMYGELLDIVTAAKKRGEKVSIHSLILAGLEKVIAERK